MKRTIWTDLALVVLAAVLLQAPSCGSTSSTVADDTLEFQRKQRELEQKERELELREREIKLREAGKAPSGDMPTVAERKKRVLVVAPENETVFNEEADKAEAIFQGYVDGVSKKYELSNSQGSYGSSGEADSNFYGNVDLGDIDGTTAFLEDFSARNGTDKVVFSKYMVDQENKSVTLTLFVYDSEKGGLEEKVEEFYYSDKAAIKSRAAKIAEQAVR